MDLYQNGTYQILKNKSKFYELFTSFLRAFYFAHKSQVSVKH